MKADEALPAFGFTTDKDHDLFKTIELVIVRDLPLHEVDQPLMREGLRYKKTCRKTIAKTIHSMIPAIEKKISSLLPKYFALMLDGWSHGSVHYVAIFACFNSEGNFHEVLLTLSPLPDETNMTASNHVALIKNSLDFYNSTLDRVVAIIGDNCSVNQSMARLLGVPLLGCASHKFALAVKDWIENQTSLDGALDVMVKVSTIKLSASLRNLTNLCAVKANETRWTSRFTILKRYFRIKGELEKIDEIVHLLPTASDNKVLRLAEPHFQQFFAVTVGLQKATHNILHSREDFDLIIQDYPCMGSRLGVNSPLTFGPVFEAAVIKILKGKEVEMTPEEQAKMSKYEVHSKSAVTIDDPSSDPTRYYETLQSRKKQRLTKANYIDFGFLASTSNTAELLFSSCKIVLEALRMSMSPLTFEAIMFLKFNRKHWNVQTVAYAVNHPLDVIYSSDEDE
ncbi:hypothetical protein ACHHYP_11401 [Achlya hypogyna]|uniref:HAT C-terminal dimerisation domain-containing protein n=1 Tax=Achlya hypogyna TaxID=1202772 RepID=A0A1V9YJ89_ACHHY|nr:hypothetical protein ACHHYP_11401 [Achlya hypogyna]